MILKRSIAGTICNKIWPVLWLNAWGAKKVKVEHFPPRGLYQEFELFVLKWELINMDFVTGLPQSRNQFESTWFIVNRMTKSSHFYPVRTHFF